jgi:hypothetical protein
MAKGGRLCAAMSFIGRIKDMKKLIYTQPKRQYSLIVRPPPAKSDKDGYVLMIMSLIVGHGRAVEAEAIGGDR